MSTGDTRTRILDAAEELFAAKGFDGTSIRAITRAADVNVAAIHYHFGSKEEVLRGVTDRIVGPLNERRFELLEQSIAESAPGPPSLEAVLDAFIRPDFEALQDLRPSAAHFVGRIYADQTPWIRQMASDQFAETRSRFFPILAAVLPHLHIDEIGWRMYQVTVLIIHTFATWPEDGMTSTDVENRLRGLITFVMPAVEAPKGVSATKSW
jgi:AcrR family transcriptional regulator